MRNVRALALAWLLTLLVGCTPADTQDSPDSPAQPPILVREKYDTVLIMAIDRSGSFVSLMKPGAKGHEFMNRSIGHYFQKRNGCNDYLVVSLLGGTRQCVAWQGKPREMREDFTGIRDWEEFMEKNSDSRGSRIYDGLSDTLEIVMTDPSMWNDHTKVVLIGITDMENNLVDSYSTEGRLAQNLRAFGRKGGSVGLYFVRPDLAVEWRRKLQDYGVRNFVVEPSTTARPMIPGFDS